MSSTIPFKTERQAPRYTTFGCLVELFFVRVSRRCVRLACFSVFSVFAPLLPCSVTGGAVARNMAVRTCCALLLCSLKCSSIILQEATSWAGLET